MKRTVRMLMAAAVLTVAVAGLAACQGAASIDKAGAARQSVTILRLEMPDDAQQNGQYFAQDVAGLSHGTLKVVIDTASYPSALPANEARLVAALRAGRVGFGFVPARDWAAAGVPGFEALDTPFLVTTVQASEALAASSVAAALLRQLTPLGLAGLGLIPAEPRQILSVRPLIAPSAFRGVRVRITDNPQTAALMTSIGSHPVQGLNAGQVGGLLSSGSLAAVESAPVYALQDSYNAEAPYLTSYAIIPKFETLVATRRAWQALTAAQRSAVRQAVTDTLAQAQNVAALRETEELAQLCTNGVIIDEPSPAQLAALAREAGAAPANADVATMIQTIRRDVPRTGPQLSPVPLPAVCRTAQTQAQAILLHGLTVGARSSTHGATIPPGTYVTTDTVADFRAGGLNGPDWQTTTVFILYFYPNRTTLLDQRPNYPDAGIGRGHYVVHGNEVTFIWDAITGLTPSTVRWSYYEGELTFALVNVQDQGQQVIFTAHLWRKVG